MSAPVSAPVGDTGVVVEGYVDLMFEDEDGSLVIVDYKTDWTTDAAEQYELQLGGYIAAVRKATRLKVSAAVLVFSRRASEALAGGNSLIGEFREITLGRLSDDLPPDSEGHPDLRDVAFLAP